MLITLWLFIQLSWKLDIMDRIHSWYLWLNKKKIECLVTFIAKKNAQIQPPIKELTIFRSNFYENSLIKGSFLKQFFILDKSN